MTRPSLASLLAASIAASAVAADTDPRVVAAREAAKSLGGQLKAELQAAMKSGGPVAAVDTCHLQAPLIAGQVSGQTGMQVGRTSLRLRNPNNAPDAWERAVLEDFERRKAAGEAPASLEHHEIVERGGERVFRYMKAIPTAAVCLNCHGGDEVQPAVEAKIAEHYPTDRARGFSEGDIRGAFTITSAP